MTIIRRTLAAPSSFRAAEETAVDGSVHRTDRRWNQALAQLVTALVVLLASICFAAEPASASSTSCSSASDTSCVGQDPTMCANPGTVTTSGVFKSDANNTSGYVWGLAIYAPDLSGIVREVGVIQLRWSPTCLMNWARIIFYTSGFHGELSAWNPNQPSQTSWIGYDGSGNHFTRTVNGIAEACVGMQVYFEGIWRAWDFGYCV
jgi:hypothetical protein